MNIAKDFPILKEKIGQHKLIYLDNAATTQNPLSVIEAESDYYKKRNSNVHRGVHHLSMKATDEYESAHEEIAGFINAHKNEIVFTSGTTDSINMLALMLKDKIKKGDNIIVSDLEHHSNFVIWQKLADLTKSELRMISLKDYQLDLNSVKELIDKNTKIIAISHMSNVLGTITPLKEIVKIKNKINKNALIIVDAAQSAAHMQIDVKDLDIDFLAFSAHKMYGPTGIGVLYGKYELLDKLEPVYLGGGMVDKVNEKNTTYNQTPQKFEAGTPKIAQAIGFRESVRYLNKLNMKKIEDYEIELTKYALAELKKIKEIKIIGPEKVIENHEIIRGSVISFIVENIDSFDIGEYLNNYGIAVRTGLHCTQILFKKLNTNGAIRISLSIYNTKQEIDKTIEILKKAIKVFKK